FCFAVVLRRCCSGGCVGFLVCDSGFYLFVALLVLYKMNLDNYEEPRVLVTCRSRLGQQIELLGDETDIVPLYYHIVDNFQIQFGREEFCLVTGLRFGVEYWADYNNEDDPIPFRRQVFSSAKDGILQFVLLGLKDRRGVPDWILRLANDRDGWDKYPWGSYVWPTLYSQLRDANAFKTWILESFRVGVNDYYKRHRLYPRIGRLPTERLTPDQNEARSDWWVSSRAYFNGRISEAERVPHHDMSVGPVRQLNKGSIIVDQHYGLSDFSEFQSLQGGPSSFSTHGNNSFFEGAQVTPFYGHNMATPNWQTPMPSHPSTYNWQTQMPSHSATPNWQTTMPSHPHDAGLFNPNLLNRARREARPSMYRRTSYMDLPPTTVLPKKRGDKTKNKGKNSNVSPLNLGNTFADDNV
ncbi:hypothetical protein Tco_0995134, partial [Tanacetum coccineum]